MNYKLKLTQFSSSQFIRWGRETESALMVNSSTGCLFTSSTVQQVQTETASMLMLAVIQHKPLSSESDEIEIINWNVISRSAQLCSVAQSLRRLMIDSQLCMPIRSTTNINGYTTTASLQVLTNNSINVLIYGVSKSKWATVLPNWLLYEFYIFFLTQNETIQFEHFHFHHEAYIWA